MTILKYKNYIGSAEISVEDGVLHGKLLHIKDLVTYETDSVEKLEEVFREAVTEYINDCAEQEREPDVPFKGSFNVRTSPKLHRDLYFAAKKASRNLNEHVNHLLSQRLAEDVQGRTLEIGRWNWIMQSSPGYERKALLRVMSATPPERKRDEHTKRESDVEKSAWVEARPITNTLQ